MIVKKSTYKYWIKEILDLPFKEILFNNLFYNKEYKFTITLIVYYKKNEKTDDLHKNIIFILLFYLYLKQRNERTIL